MKPLAVYSSKVYISKNSDLIMNRHTADKIKLTVSEARLIAHICGDGSIGCYKRKRSPADLKNHKRRNPYVNVCYMSYCNNEKDLLDIFVKDVKEVYGLKAYYKNNNSVQFTGKWVYKRLRRFGAGQSFDWFISKEIMYAKKEIIKEWLKAFFDDESYVELSKLRITLNSVNLSGLKQVQELLKKFKIQFTTLHRPYFTRGFPIYRLSILKEDVERYFVYVGFNHQKKIRDLTELLELRALTF